MIVENHEKILIEGLKEKNEKIFDYVFHLYYSSLVVYCRQIISDHQTAEDIVQGFFLKIWSNSHALHIDQSLKSYFFKSVRNRSLDYLRQQKVKAEVEKKIIDEKIATIHNHHFFVETELRQYIDAALEKLPPVCHEIFVMNRFEGLKPKVIAEKKGISVRTVEGHIGKALKIMKKELEQFFPSFLVMIILKSIV